MAAPADQQIDFKPDDEIQFTPDDQGSSFMQNAATGVKGLAKGLDTIDLGGPVGRPALALALQALTGKKVFNPQEYKNTALNIGSTETYPNSAKLMDRAGVPPGAKVSDYLPSIYAKPSKNNPWYRLEVGGALDPNVRDAGGLAADVGLSMGGGKLIGAAAEAGGPILSRLSKILLAPAAETTGALGDKAYGSALNKVTAAGEALSKGNVADTYYKAGVSSPFNLVKDAKTQAADLLEKRNEILKHATDKGAKIDLDKALGGAQTLADSLKSSSNKSAKSMAEDMQEIIDGFRKDAAGVPEVPGTPASSQVVQSPILDASGNPISREVPVPGTPATPAIPGKTFSPLDASFEKTIASKAGNQGKYAVHAGSKDWDNFHKALAGGFQKETESSVANALGKDIGEGLTDTNKQLGDLISPKIKRAQLTTQNDAKRLLGRAMTPTGSDTILGLGTGMVTGSPSVGLSTIAAKHAGDLLRTQIMPFGYAAKKFGDSSIAGPLTDAYLRQKLINSQRSPWSDIQFTPDQK